MASDDKQHSPKIKKKYRGKKKRKVTPDISRMVLCPKIMTNKVLLSPQRNRKWKMFSESHDEKDKKSKENHDRLRKTLEIARFLTMLRNDMFHHDENSNSDSKGAFK